MSVVREALLALHEQHGQLTPPIVVHAASDPAHPLHDRFEWDDAKAAHKHRLDQARGLIRSLRIEYRAPDGERRSVREFVSVARETGRTYDPTIAVAQDPRATAAVLADMAREWRMLRRRYGHMREFMEMVARDLDGDDGPDQRAS